MADKDFLERAIFGGSDSELSDEEDQVPQRKLQQCRPSAAGRAESPAHSEDDSTEKRVIKSKKRAEPSKSIEDSRPKQRKRKRGVPEPVEPSELPSRYETKRRIEKQIAAILKPRGSRSRKGKGKEPVFDQFADDQIARLRENMNDAAEQDIESNKAKLPGLAKIKLLPEVMETLQKPAVFQAVIDNNLLESVKRWLEPLPDRSLPSISIQREFFPLLDWMEFIDGDILKESGLGRLVHFYSKNKRVTIEIKRIVNALFAKWMRPFTERPVSDTDEPLHSNYLVAPSAKSGIMSKMDLVHMDFERSKRNADRLKDLKRKAKAM